MKTIKTQLRKIVLVLLSGMFLFSVASCTSGTKSETAKNESAESTLNKDEFEQKVKEVVYPLPTTFEVTEMINKVEASYIIGLSNSPQNSDNYFTDKDQALNLGIYNADLSYASTYNMQQEVMSYMEALEGLVFELGITGAFSADFVSDVEANVDNKEKLTELVTNSFYDTYAYLVKAGKEDLSLLVLVGSWVEGMYISCNISETIYHNPELVKVILHQKESLNKLLELLAPHNSHETIKGIIDQLNPIKTVYDNIDETGITENQLNQIIEQSEALRTQIIS